MRGVLPWSILWACHAGARDFCSASAALQNFFSSPFTIAIPLSPSHSKLGRQLCWVACRLVSVSVLKNGERERGGGQGGGEIRTSA
jgi:hypothetical protein